MYPLVKHNIAVGDRPLERDPLQASAPAQRHIHLAVRERAVTQVDDNIIKSLALALMDGYCPRKLKRILRERASTA
jgi:hypothetical protein